MPGAPVVRRFHGRDDRVERADDRLLLGEGAAEDEGRGLVSRPAVAEERVHHLRQLGRPGIADDGAIEPRQAGPVHRGASFAVVLVPADEGQRVARSRIGERDARVRREADARRHPGHHFEPHALLVQEERFAAAGIEKERVAPFEPRDGLALARLLGEQVADGFLLERLWRRRADVDFLGVWPRIPEQPRMHHMVIEHDVGRAETSQTRAVIKPGSPGPAPIR